MKLKVAIEKALGIGTEFWLVRPFPGNTGTL